MKKLSIMVTVLAAMLMLVSCGKPSNDLVPKGSESSQVVSEESSKKKFDIDEVGKNITVKGHKIQLPIRLGDFPNGWTYKEHGDPIGKLQSFDIYFENEFIITISAENFVEGKEKDAILFNVGFKTDDCSIDGIIPTETTIDEVIDKYGEPDDKFEDSGEVFYYYGRPNSKSRTKGVWNYNSIALNFTEDNKVIKSVTYSNAQFKN